MAAEYALITARRARLEERAGNGSRGARAALRLMDEPVRFISSTQLGITIFAILIGAIGEPLISDLMEPPLSATVSFLIAFAILTYFSVVLGELVPKAAALAEGRVARRRARRPARLPRPRRAPDRVAAAGVGERWSSGSCASTRRPPGCSRTRVRTFVTRSPRPRTSVELQEAEEEMLYKVFDFASKEVSAVMVPRPGRRRHLRRHASRGGAPGGRRLAVHALPGVSRLARRRRRDPPRPRPLRRDPRSRHRVRRARVDRAARVRRTRDEGSRGAPRRLPPREAAPGDRHRRVRRRRRDRDARGPPRGDRRRHRGRVRPSRHVHRADRRDAHPDRRHVHDRRLQRGVPHGARAGGLQHDGGARVRRARPCARGRRRGADRRPDAHRGRDRRLADHEARGRVRRRRRDAERRAGRGC